VAPETRAAIESQSTRLAALSIPPAASAADRERARGAVSSAFVAGFRRVILLGAALALLASGTALMLIGGTSRGRPKEH